MFAEHPSGVTPDLLGRTALHAAVLAPTEMLEGACKLAVELASPERLNLVAVDFTCDASSLTDAGGRTPLLTFLATQPAEVERLRISLSLMSTLNFFRHLRSLRAFRFV